MSNYRDEVLRRIKDENKMIWTLDDASLPDKDAFFTECVVPLRRLRAEGVLDKLLETPVSINGDHFIGMVEIIGGINLDA